MIEMGVALKISGSVATFAQEAMQGQLSLSVRGLRGQSVEQFGCSEVLFSCLYTYCMMWRHSFADRCLWVQ
jgi:hypothetical protein